MSRLSRMGLPLSIVSRTASRRECFCTCRARAYKYRARSWQLSACHAGKAFRAASTAAFTSSMLPLATSASVSPVEGSLVVWYSPLAGFTHAPPMNSSNRR